MAQDMYILLSYTTTSCVDLCVYMCWPYRVTCVYIVYIRVPPPPTLVYLCQVLTCGPTCAGPTAPTVSLVYTLCNGRVCVSLVCTLYVRCVYIVVQLHLCIQCGADVDTRARGVWPQGFI